MLKKSKRIHLGQLQKSGRCTVDARKDLRHLYGDLRKYAILASRGPVTSFLPMYDVFTTAHSGAVD